jgi:hypothetical protein
MRSISLVVAAVAVLVAACGVAGSPAPGGSVSAPSASPPASVAAAATASPSAASPKPSASVVIPHDDPGLEALLPDEADGKQLNKFSVGPQSSNGQGAQGIKDAVKTIGDGSGNFGVAYAGDPDGEFNLFTLRIQGADPSALLTAFARIALTETPGGKAESARLGDRPVVHIIDPVSMNDVWFWAEGDLLRGVQAKSAGQATELLALIK